MSGSHHLADSGPAVMRAGITESDHEDAPAGGSEQMLQHPAQPLSMGPGPTGIAMMALVLAVTVRRWRRRAQLPESGA